MIQFPNAKINLGLQITEKRKDGYHEITSCLYPIPLYDVLEIIPSKKTVFNATGLTIPGKPEENLIFKALNLLKKDFKDLGQVEIHLHKIIPMGAGLGGGSADGAFALKIFNNLFDLHLENWFLETYAILMGSDCPFFIDNVPKIARGRGEIMETIELDLSGKWLVLANPNIHIGTKEAYQGVVPLKPERDLNEILMDKSQWAKYLVNDFEKSIFQKHPSIKELKAKLYDSGAFYASLSGSGATVFGIFDSEPELHDFSNGQIVLKKKI